MDNIKLRHQGGLVGHMDLLRDFEEQVDKVGVHHTSDTAMATA